MTGRSWWLLLAGCWVVGLAVRVGAVLARPHLHPAGDAAEYWLLSNYVADGKGWVEPLIYKAFRTKVQTAKLPPLYTVLLIPCSLVGFKSYFAHRVWSGIISSLGVPLTARLGRDLAGPAVGVVAALGVALYPNIWMPAEVGLSETVSPLVAMLVLLAAYGMWRRPTLRRALLLGLAIGFAVLSRDEMALFIPLLLVPLAYGRRGEARTWTQRGRLLGAGLGAAILVVGPWVGYNLARFPKPVFVTDRLGLTLASANCPATWHGSLAGYWVQSCAIAAVAGSGGDESAQDGVATSAALHYVGQNLGSLPAVEVERLGRTFGFWRVGQQMKFDSFFDGRPRPWTWVGLGSFYGLVALAPFGLARLRRSGVPTFPLWVVLADVVVVVLVTYGQTRFRATLEPVLVLLGAVAVCSMLRHRDSAGAAA